MSDKPPLLSDMFLPRWQIDGVPRRLKAPAGRAGLTWLHLSILAATLSLSWCSQHSQMHKTTNTRCLLLPSHPKPIANQGQPLGPARHAICLGWRDIWPSPNTEISLQRGGRHICILFLCFILRKLFLSFWLTFISLAGYQQRQRFRVSY